MKNLNNFFKISLSLVSLCLIFAPFIFFNGALINPIKGIFGNLNLYLTMLIGLIIALLLAMNVLTYFKKLLNFKFIIAILLFVSTCLFIFIWDKIDTGIAINAGPGYFALLVLSFVLVILDSRHFFQNNTLILRDIVDIALFVSLAIVLDLPFLKIHISENGGSISLTMLPLILLSLKRGPIKGFIASGIIYGLLTCIFDGYGFASYPLDYLFGYGSMCLVGLFRKPILSIKNKGLKYVFLIVGTLLAGVSRTLFSTLSGVILYQTGFIESLIINSSYIWPSILGVSIVSILILPIFLQIMKKYPR
ncbi:MAG: energy-coupled thiamine transporter ThiT [Bacilli bacterium]|nr:energy-coupled thiamine transporter ThiT [Bacilli bacterium]